jgi:FAD/FMN-containing dehydrogenase
MSTQTLMENITGQLILPGDSNYDEARTIYNAMIDKRPAMILKCKNEQDVVLGIDFARKNNLELSIKSGGHNGAGLALVDDGFVIDLSEMKTIEINPENRTALIEPGNTLGDVDMATHEHGLALPSGIIGTTGIGGITLGGGLGYLSRKGGLTIDHLLEARIVLSSGEIVTASKTSHPELLWALKGGGGNFGVVVSFTFSLIPLKNVYGGPMFWPIEKAKEVMKFYAQLTREASNDLYGFFAFLIVPPGDPFPEALHGQNVCGVVWCYSGPMEKAEEVFKPIRDFGPPILDFVGEIPVPALNTMFDALYPPGLQWYWKAHFLNEMTDASIDANIEYGSKLPSMHSTTHFYAIDGKVHDVGQDESAWSHRNARWAQVIVGVDPDPANAEKVTKWCRDYYDATAPFAASKGGYVNFIMDEGNEKVRASYGSNYDRLVEIKAQYDPENIFHINQNIKPD